MKPKTLNAKIVSILTPLIEREYGHFYNYKASANYCRGVGFFKAAAFYETEAKEEAEHAARLQAFLTDWNIIPDLPAIAAPDLKLISLADTVRKAYEREYDLYETYEEASAKVFDMDVCVFDFLQQFRKIQQDTVAEYSDKLNLLEGVDPTKINLLLMEEKLFT